MKNRRGELRKKVVLLREVLPDVTDTIRVFEQDLDALESSPSTFQYALKENSNVSANISRRQLVIRLS